MTILGELCCVALPFCCVVVVALPFSASLEAIVHACTRNNMVISKRLIATFSNKLVVALHKGSNWNVLVCSPSSVGIQCNLAHSGYLPL